MERFDAIVVGAGFSGLYMLHKLREQRMSARVYEAGDNVGGVWYWNRYPGAKCDVESIYYNYTFSEELYKEWTWTSRYPDQPSILRYLNHVADRFDLRRDIQFKTRVTAAHYDEKAREWRVKTDNGKTVAARYFISGAGCLSAANRPDIKGLESFRGEVFHTGTWPHQPVEFTGKRVGVIGTGSSGIQAIPVIAGQADQLYVFQRTPQYSTPAADRPYDAEHIREVKENLGEIRTRVRNSWSGVPRSPIAMERSALAEPPLQRRQTYEAAWQHGGWIHSSYSDLITDAQANETVAQFVRDKIRSIVKDPQVADKLTPGYLFGTKRPVIDTDYFQTYNRDNVTLVDIRQDPITEITPDGVRTARTGYALDALVLATGYDAITGPLFRIDIRGKDGMSLQDKWGGGKEIHTYLGLANAGFPNFFTITGPQSPSVLSNMVCSIEQHVEWIADCLRHLRDQGLDTIEATVTAEQAWSKHCAEVAHTTLFPRGESWYTGANIPGKTMPFPIYVAGVNVYRGVCDKVAANGYEGFALTRSATAR